MVERTPDSDVAAAVRIEYSNDDGAFAPPVLKGPVGDGNSGSRRLAVAALVLALGLVAVLIIGSRPDEGQTAAGTPITVPTTVVASNPDEPTSDTDVANEQDGVSNTATPSRDSDGVVDESSGDFESVLFDQFMFSIVEADFGWISMAFTNGDEAGLWRSVDGMQWTELPAEGRPPGDVIGFDRIDGTYLLAVDEDLSWSTGALDFGDDSFPEHTITIWQSSDALNWFPTDRPSLEGFGFPYPASFTRDTYVVPMVVPPSGGNPLIIEYLAPFVDAEVAVRVCSLRRSFSEDGQSVVLDDCNGQPIAEVSESDHPDEFGRLARDSCLEIALERGARRGVSVVVSGDEPPQQVELTLTFGVFGRATGPGLLARSGFAFNSELEPECGGSSELSSEVRTIYWSEASGEVDVTPAGSGDEPIAGQPASVVRDDDGRIRLATNEGVWVGDAPFDQWELLLGAPDLPPAIQGERTRDLTISHNGRGAAIHSRGQLHIWVEGQDWESFDFTGLNDTRLLLATDEFVVITGQSRAGTELVKVHLS